MTEENCDGAYAQSAAQLLREALGVFPEFSIPAPPPPLLSSADTLCDSPFVIFPTALIHGGNCRHMASLIQESTSLAILFLLFPDTRIE